MSQPKHVIISRTPASCWAARWREAFPTGNGQIGAAVYGGVFRERVLLTHEDLWRGSQTPELPDVSHALPEARRLLLENRPAEAEPVISDALKAAGYAPGMGSPVPLGDLIIEMPARNAFKRYRRVLDLETGEVSVSWLDGETKYERSLFVSRADDVVAMEIRADAPIDAEIRLDLHDRDDVRKPNNWPAAALPAGVEVLAEGNSLCYAAENDDGTDFGAVAKVTVEGGSVEAGDGCLVVAGADRVLVLLRVFIRGERRTDWARLHDELAACEASYDELLTPHAEAHGRIFNRVALDPGGEDRERSNEELLLDAYDGDAPTALVERMWAYGRHMLVASSREGGHPCPLHGLWCGEYDGFWAFNMCNENLQMICWQALSGNMPELLLPVFDYYERNLDDLRENARKLYGCRGIYIPAPTAPDSGLLKTIAPHIIHWTGGAGWVAQHYYDYYLHAGDEEFLRERALPFMREVALFYEDFFVTDDDGLYMSIPSNSPENTPGNLWGGEGMGAQLETTINATMDFAIAKELLTNLIEGARTVGQHANEIGRAHV